MSFFNSDVCLKLVGKIWSRCNTRTKMRKTFLMKNRFAKNTLFFLSSFSPKSICLGLHLFFVKYLFFPLVYSLPDVTLLLTYSIIYLTHHLFTIIYVSIEAGRIWGWVLHGFIAPKKNFLHFFPSLTTLKIKSNLEADEGQENPAQQAH